MEYIDFFLRECGFGLSHQILLAFCSSYDECLDAQGRVEPKEVLGSMTDADSATVAILREALERSGDPEAVLRAVHDAGADAVFNRQMELSADTDPVQSPEGAEDMDAWAGFLASYGPSWDGKEENWQAFRDWFTYEAAGNGIGQTAVGFVDYAESTGDKIRVFSEYGIAIVQHASYEARFGAPAGADGEIAQEFCSVEQVVDRIGSRVIAEFRTGHPGLDEVTDAQILELLAQEVVRSISES